MRGGWSVLSCHSQVKRMALMLCPLLGSRRNQTEPVVNRISEVLLDLLANALSTVT